MPGMQDVYAKFDCLVEVRCQICGRSFAVGACSDDPVADLCAHGVKVASAVMPTATDPGFAYWGDAPWHEDGLGQCAGTTMSSELVRVLEFWARDERFEWARMAEREVAFAQGA